MNKTIDNKYTRLFTLFGICLRLGAFTFGGGYAMFPLMQKEYVDTQKWFGNEDMLDILAVSQSLPGMISINASIIVGYRICGVLGSLVAVLGLTLPSLIVMSLISYYYIQFSTNRYVIAALKGIRIAVIALLVQAMMKLGKPGIKGTFGWIMAAIAFVLAIFSGIHLIIIIVAGAVVGIIHTYIGDNRTHSTQEEAK